MTYTQTQVLCIHWSFRSEVVFRGLIHFAQDDPASRYVSTRPKIQVPSANVDLAERWINDCLESHQLCPGPSLSVLPTRVIDVGVEDRSEEPRLFLSQGCKDRYATLSYCWGGPQPITLTRATVDKKQLGMPAIELPAAFQDAIKVTRNLGLRYLWIGALCIIQDDDFDKAIEMAKMDHIYQDAFVTIAAANSSRCSTSFLETFVPQEAPEPYRFAKIDFPCPDGLLGSIFLKPNPGDYAPRSEPLNTRGWALQERLLSPRVLTFGSQQMYWQCQSEIQCDGGSVRKFHHPARLGHEFFRCKGGDKPPTDSKLVYENWQSLINDYSERQLTTRTDVLPALSGIATRFASILQDTYCAGLWRNDLQNTLVWNVNFSQPARPSEFRAPSWSWASIDSGVFWYPRRAKIESEMARLTRVVSCEVQPLYPTARFGEVTSGILELRGRVKDFDWSGSDWIANAVNPRVGVPVRLDVETETLERGVSSEIPRSVDLCLGRGQENFIQVTRSVSCIPLTDEYSLLLERRQDGNYVRVGLVDFFIPRHDEVNDEWYETEDIQKFYEDAEERTIFIV
jgi:Heterokaryon incompatibility protein (HET)